MKKSRLNYALSLLISVTALVSCNKSDKKDSPQLFDQQSEKQNEIIRFKWTQINPEVAPEIKVINQFGEPVVQAKILIGDSVGFPFKGNFLETDAAGKAQIPKEWINQQHVTVDAAGYIRQTLLNQKPGNIVLKLNTAFLPQRVELHGLVTDLPVVNKDKLVDFGLVMPALTRSDILNFDMDQVISPYTDALTVAGQKEEMPSNISLPAQKENYIIPVTISKPLYRLMIPTLGPKTFFAASGRFPLKPVVDELQNGKPFYELLNYFTILGGGIRETAIVNAVTNLDIPGVELKFQDKVQVTSATTLPDEVLMMIAVSDISGTFIPTDVKKMPSNQTITLTAMAGKPVMIVSVIKKQAEFITRTAGSDRLSAALAPYKMGEKQTLLPLVENPTIAMTDSYTITLPNAPSAIGINPLAISASISDLIETADGPNKITTANRRWDIIGLGWSAQIHLPIWPLDNTSVTKKVEINFIGSTSNQAVNLDDSLIQAATHVSHSSANF